MKQLLALLLLAICAATAQGQIIKSLGYNTTNGSVVYTGTNALTFTNNTVNFLNDVNFVNDVSFANGELTVVGQTISGGNVSLSFEDGELTGSLIFQNGHLAFQNTTNAAITRTNLKLPLAALTNTSNVTAMRALAGSTNTNEPFSGVFGFDDGQLNAVSITVSNGIILDIQ